MIRRRILARTRQSRLTTRQVYNAPSNEKRCPHDILPRKDSSHHFSPPHALKPLLSRSHLTDASRRIWQAAIESGAATVGQLRLLAVARANACRVNCIASGITTLVSADMI